jgi:putative sterol carrier protein
MPTVKEIFEVMPRSFNQAAAAGMQAVILFDITGEGGGKWFVEIRNDKISIAPEYGSKPDLTISATVKDYIDISTGALNEQLAFMTGRITARGDTSLAMKLPRIFPR